MNEVINIQMAPGRKQVPLPPTPPTTPRGSQSNMGIVCGEERQVELI